MIDLDQLGKIANLQQDYENHIMDLRKKAIENAKLEVSLISDTVTLQTKMWAVKQMERMYNEYLRGMYNTRRAMAVLQSAFLKLNYVDELEPKNVPSMWAGYRYISRYLGNAWKFAKVSNGAPRISVINDCMITTPERGSPQHYLLVECLSSCTEIFTVLGDSLNKQYTQLQQGRVDIWNNADWALK